MKNIVNLRDLRENVATYAMRVQQGESFVIIKRSKPLFKISPIEDDLWEAIIDFTKIQRGGVDINELLARLQRGMPDKIEKALRKLSEKERGRLKSLLLLIKSGTLNGLDLAKLKGTDDIYRVRKGDLRVIFRKTKDDVIMILAIERRSDTTYSNY